MHAAPSQHETFGPHGKLKWTESKKICSKSGTSVARVHRDGQEAVKSAVRSDESENIYEKAKSLLKQGRFLEMTLLEKSDAAWKSFIYQLPQGTMKWILNSAIDTLPTLSNLKKWGKVSSDICKICNVRRETLAHITNNCEVALNQGRWNFRHDSILNFVSNCIERMEGMEVYIDIPGQQTTAAGTVPPSVTVTSEKPDICIVDRRPPRNSVHLYELTVPQESRIDEANRLKTNKYSHFLTDIRNRNVSIHPFEIGSATGHINDRNKSTLTSLHKFAKKDIPLKSFSSNISAIAILCSYFIFNARKQKEWHSPGYVGPPLKMKTRNRNIGAS